MLLGILIGIFMPDWRALFLGALGAPILRIGYFLAFNGPTALWSEYAAMAIVSYLICLIVAALVFGFKRVLRAGRVARSGE